MAKVHSTRARERVSSIGERGTSPAGTMLNDAHFCLPTASRSLSEGHLHGSAPPGWGHARGQLEPAKDNTESTSGTPNSRLTWCARLPSPRRWRARPSSAILLLLLAASRSVGDCQSGAAHTKLPKCWQGTPVDSTCTETSAGVFERKWSKGVVQMDCNQWTGTVPGVKTDDPTIQRRLGGFLGAKKG